MNVIIISGSRNPEGQTAMAVQALTAGIRQAGSTVETVFLPTVHNDHCRQCDQAGWGLCRREGRCVIEDDFAGIVDRLRAADRIVFANPVYFSDLSESLRAFLDRLRRICRHENGKAGIAGKPALGICVAGGGGGGAPAACRRLEHALQTTGFTVVDLVPVRRQNLEFKAEVLDLTGRWLVSKAVQA